MAEEPEDPHEYDVYARVRGEGYRYLQLHCVQGIAQLVLQRPPANVLSIEMLDDLNQALESLEYQRDVKLVVLQAQGTHFSGGFELGELVGDRAYLVLEAFRRVFENLAKLDKPSLAVVAGPALGAGSVLAAGCDIVLAAASARFGLPEIRAGVFNTVAAALLPRLIGRRRACELLLSGVTLSAADAERIELVTRVVPDERLAAETSALVQRFQDGSAPVFQAARRALYGGLDLPFLDAVMHAEDVYLNQLMASEDAVEGLKAVQERRRPQWKDR